MGYRRRYYKRHQVKSSRYYLFWFVMAVAVVTGQVYVGNGYRIMSRDLRNYTEAVYNTQMGWGSYQQQLEKQANQPKKSNRTFEFE
jgi:hypothetical protein